MITATSDFMSFRFPRAPLQPGGMPPDVERVFRSFGFERRILSVSSDDACHSDIAIHVVRRSGGEPGDSGVYVLRMAHTAGVSVERPPDLLFNDDVVLHIHETGQRTISQLGREATVGAGGALLSSNSDVAMVVLPTAARFITIGLPRKPMLALAPALEDAFVRPLPPNPGVLRLLSNYADVLEDDRTTKTPELQRAAAAHIHDLCALAIGATCDAAEIARRRSLPAARLRAIKDYILQNLGEENLSVAALAARQRVTPRYIHKLFESAGTTFSQFVLGQRLARVHRMLSDPRYAYRTIGALAFEVGFGDLSAFNRAFRRHFGATPSDVRAATRNGVGVNAPPTLKR